jgi:hypothetical protein
MIRKFSVSVAKIQLHRFRMPAVYLLGEQVGRKLANRLLKNGDASNTDIANPTTGIASNISTLDPPPPEPQQVGHNLANRLVQDGDASNTDIPSYSQDVASNVSTLDPPSPEPQQVGQKLVNRLVEDDDASNTDISNPTQDVVSSISTLDPPPPEPQQVEQKLATEVVEDDDASNTDISNPTQDVASDIATLAPLAPEPQAIERQRYLGPWSLLWLSVILVLGGTGVIGVLLLTTLPPPPNCQSISPLAADAERLYCAQLAAQSGKLDKLLAAMKLVQGWSVNDPLYNDAQRLKEEWSRDILAIARQHLKQGDIQTAIAVAKQIPESSPLYAQTQATIASWQQQWQQGEQIIGKFQNAVKVQNWKQAWQQLESLLQLSSNYWRTSKHDQLMLQLAIEKQSWQQLQDARNLANSSTPEQLADAIAMAGKVNPSSYFKAQAQAERNKWSSALLQTAATLFRSQNFSGAIARAKGVPADVSVYPEAQDWIRLSRASEAGQKNQVMSFLDALSQVRQISPKSRLYVEATARESLWQSQLQDLMQLQYASAIAGFDQGITLQMAIDHAQLVGPKRPERILAQTLIASWRKQLQQIQDRSTLAQARVLGKPGTIDSLHSAIALASQVALGQPLRIEAQTAIAQWNQQIQTIEDQPLLDLARAFAQQGDLASAIETAQKIRPGRALAKEAQTAVDDWVDQIQISQDRPLLDAAKALADQGRLKAAMVTASQIRADRPLYPEAQAAIARWQSKLGPIPTFSQGSSRQAVTDPDSSSSPTQ